MFFKSMITAICVCLTIVSFNANSAVVNTLNGVNYKWLEFSATMGMSRDLIETRLLDPNDALYGYEYASRILVEDLLMSYSSWDGLNGYHQNSDVLVGMDQLFNDFGFTETTIRSSINLHDTVDSGPLVPYNTVNLSKVLYGSESECSSVNYTCVAELFELSIDGQTTTAALQLGYSGYDSTAVSPLLTLTSNSDPAYASFLVASVVPIPSAIWLFGSGLIGLISIARKKHSCTAAN